MWWITCLIKKGYILKALLYLTQSSLVTTGSIFSKILIEWATYIISLWPSDAIWSHRSGSTLAQIMACCLMSPSHYLKQCWFVMNRVLWHYVKSTSPQVLKISIDQMNLKCTLETFLTHLPGINELYTNTLVPWSLWWYMNYRQVSNIRRTKSQHLKDSRTVLRLSLPNPLKPDVKSRMKM